MGVTTIQIEDDVKESLDRLKKKSEAKTYNEVIQRLLSPKRKSLYGFLAKKKKISFEAMMKGLRDKHDRF